jgi:serine carboxypeptidase-like clade II
LLKIYAGDVTFNVPFIGTAVWTEQLGAPTGVKQDWTSWLVNGQVAGYVKKYNGLNFVTVKNAGHMYVK